MPLWLYTALTLLPPMTGLLLAVVGSFAFFAMLMNISDRLKYVSACITVAGAFGLANVIVGVMY